MKPSTIITILLALALVVAGCGVTGAPLAAGTEDLVELGLVSEADIDDAGKQQLEVLADGKLTRNEYEDQFDRTMQCMQDLGVKIIDGPDWHLEQLVFFYGDVEDTERQRADEATFAACWSEDAKLVYERWSVDHAAKIEAAIEADRLANP